MASVEAKKWGVLRHPPLGALCFVTADRKICHSVLTWYGIGGILREVPDNRQGGMIMKLSISLNDDLVKRIDEYTKSMSISRSGFLAMAANQYLNQQQMLGALPDLLELNKKLESSDRN